MKKCTVCKEIKDLNSFSKRSEAYDGKRSECKTCNTKASINYQKRHPEKIKVINKRWRDKHKEKLAIMRIGYKYGVSPEEYQSMLDEQNGVCAVCFKPEHRRGLSVDHCHKTGKVRGLLCSTCNMAIGLLKDDTKIFNRVVEYLKEAA